MLTVGAEGADLLFPPQQPLQQDDISQYHCQVDRNSQCEKVYSFVVMSKCRQGPYQLPADVIELVLRVAQGDLRVGQLLVKVVDGLFV